MDGLLGPRLLKGSEEVATSSVAGGGIIGIYFSAHWCGPCQEYTPQLRKVYERAKKKGKAFEIVFVSQDRDEASFRSYFKTMPWHAVPFADRMRQQVLSNAFQVKGIPSLVLVNGSGGLIDPNARAKVMNPGYLATIPRVIDVRDVGPLPQEPVMLTVRHNGQDHEVECEPEEGWEMLRMQIFSLTEVAEGQQRLFGLGVPMGPLDESVPLPRALAGGLFAQRGSGLLLAEVAQDKRVASSTHNDEKQGDPHHSGHMDSQTSWVGKKEGDKDLWYQLDLGSAQDVAGVAVAPRADADQWVERLKISTSESEGGTWTFADDGNEFEGCVVFPQEAVRIVLSKAVRARFVRIHPTAWNKHPSLRADVLLANGGGKDEPPSIVVLGNASKDDPFEFSLSSPAPAVNKMVQEQHLAMLQVKVGNLPPRLQQQIGQLQAAKGYEDRTLQRQAQDDVPVCALDRLVREGKTGEGYEVAFMKKVLFWYKKGFFEWTNAPKCDHCGSTSTKTVGRTEPNPIERQFGAGTVEVAQCSACGQQTRFPRYNDPSKLLEWRQGRCGEWANCFTLVCRALGYEARHCHDWTDHVWTEVYSDSLQRWLHADSCEQALDSPLMYEGGWGKKLTYVLAYSRDHCVDVTRRYTRKFDELLARRSQFSEQDLKRAMYAINEFAIDRAMAEFDEPTGARRREVLEQRAKKEGEDFEKSVQAAAKPDEQIGRTSGDAQWREQRGELGADGDAKAKALALSGEGVACASTPAGSASPSGGKQKRDKNDLKDLVQAKFKLVMATGQPPNEAAAVAMGLAQRVQQATPATAMASLVASPIHDTGSSNDWRLIGKMGPLSEDAEAISATIRWSDQGFGNAKGRARARLHRGGAALATVDLFGIAPQEIGEASKQLVEIEEKRPTAGDTIVFEYQVGGGGGHQLHITSFEAFAVGAAPQAASAASAGAVAPKAAAEPAAAPAPVAATPGSSAPAAAATAPPADDKAKRAEAMKALFEAKIAELLQVEPSLSRTEATARVLQNLKSGATKLV